MENGATNPKSETEDDVDAKKVNPEAEEKPKETGDISTSEEKTEETKTEPTPELLQKIKSQIEFYFGDVNMHKDKFLKEQTKLDEGWVPLTVMLNFKMLARMSTDPEVVIKALESSDLMEISEDKKKIRRSTQHPLPVYNEEYKKAQEARTVYMKGFPLTEMTIEKFKTFLAPYEPVENIIMRKYKGSDKVHHFKGSIFVQFKTLDGAKAFMAREPLKYNDTELIRKWVADYYVEKAKEKEELKAKKKSGKKSQDAKATEESENEEPVRTIDLPKGSAIFMSDVPDGIAIENIKEGLQSLDLLVAFIDYSKGDKQGWIRLQGEDAASSAMAKLTDGKLKVRQVQTGKPVEKEEGEEGTPAKKRCTTKEVECEIQCRLPEGDEEEKYLEKAKAQIANIRSNFRNKRKRASRGRQNSKFRHNSNEDKSKKHKLNESKEGSAKKIKLNEGS